MKKGTKIIKKGTGMVLTVAMIFGLMLGISKPQVVHAEGNSKNINLGTKGISDPIIRGLEDYAYPWYGSYVYFGSYNGTMVKYRVLDAQTTDFSRDGITPTMLLDCNMILWNGDNPSSKFDDSSNVWANSYIKKYLNSEGEYSSPGFLTTSFTPQEQSAIAESTKETSLELEEISGTLNYARLNGDKIFLLDATEAENEVYGYSHTDRRTGSRLKSIKKDSGINKSYWLRTAEKSNSSNACFVDSDAMNHSGSILVNPVKDSYIGVSPALNLKLSSVIFTSATESSKSSHSITDFSSLPGVSDYFGVEDSYYGSREEWKLTLSDSSVSAPTITNVVRNGDTLSFDYAGVKIGENQKLSAIITSGTGASETIVSYGVLKDAAENKGGSVAITLPSDWDSKGYTLKVFSEQNNGDKKTDYAGAFAALTVPVKYTVTASAKTAAGEAVNAELTGLTGYVSGAEATVTAGIASGYNFVGWYQASSEAPGYTGDILSKNRVYTFKVNENTNLVAVYKLLGTASITVNGGNSYTINGSEYTAPNTGTYSLGTNVTVAVSDTTDFAYWANEHGMIVSRNASYTFPVTGPITLTAVYNTKTENKSTVIFESYYGQVMSRMQLGSGDAVTMPAGPTRYGYTFTKWSMTADDIQKQIAAGTAVIRVIPVYELINQSYTITVTGGTGSGSYKQNDVVTATADTPESGKKFSHWTDGAGNILSYSTTYQFYATGDVTIIANYVTESSAVEAKGTAEVIDVKKDKANSKISFVSMLTVPEGCTIQVAGIIATANGTVANSGDGFNKNTADYVRGNAWSGNAYRYTWTKKVTADQTWYVRAYLLYKDTNGNLVTVYGTMMTAGLNN